MPVLFIRAPRFCELDEGVGVLSRWGHDVTGLIYRGFTAVTYHPELGGETRFHRAWYERVVQPREVLV